MQTAIATLILLLYRENGFYSVFVFCKYSRTWQHKRVEKVALDGTTLIELGDRCLEFSRYPASNVLGNWIRAPLSSCSRVLSFPEARVYRNASGVASVSVTDPVVTLVEAQMRRLGYHIMTSLSRLQFVL